MSMGDKQKMYAGFVIAILAFGILYLYWPQQGGETGMKVGGTLVIDYGDGSPPVTMYSENVATDPWARLRNFVGLDVLADTGGKAFTANSKITLSEFALWSVKPSNPDGTARSANVQYWVNGYIVVNGMFQEGIRSYLCGVTGLPGKMFTTVPTAPPKSGSQSTNYWNAWNQFGLSSFLANYYAEQGSGIPFGNINTGRTNIDVAKAIQATVGGAPFVGDVANAFGTTLGQTNIKDGRKDYLFGLVKPIYEVHADLGRIQWKGLSFNSGSVNVGCLTFGAGTWTRLDVGDTYTLDFRMSYIYRFQDVTGSWSNWKSGDVKLFSFTTRVQDGTYTTVTLNPGGGYSVYG